MILLYIYSRDDKFIESVINLTAKALKTRKVEDNIQIKKTTGEKYDLLHCLENGDTQFAFTNVYMIDLDSNVDEGINIAKAIRKKNPLAYIVFASDMLLDVKDFMGHSIKAFNFFCKPIGTFEYVDLLNDIVFDYNQITKLKTYYYSGSITVISEYRKSNILLSDIIAVEFSRRKSVIITTNGKIEVNSSMQELMNLMNKADSLGTIVRTHQSFIANLTNVETMDIKNLELIMKKGIRVPIARTRKQTVQDAVESVFNTEVANRTKTF